MTAHPALPVLTACPCCGGALSEPIFEAGPVPVHSCLMLDDATAAAAFPQSHLRLAACRSCGFVTNTVFDPIWSAYDPSYEDQQSFSPVFSGFAFDLARQTIDRFDLHGKRAVEVGCSKGDFMRLLAEQGEMDCTGIDPSVLPGRVPSPSRGAMRFEQAYYGPKHTTLPADLLTCRHTLEHIQDVAGTLALFARHVAANPGAILQIEVPCATRLWTDCAFEDIYYEHCSYFTPGSLARALRRAGFAVLDLRREYDDQYLIAEACMDPAKDGHFALEETPAETIAALKDFSARMASKLMGWRDRIKAASAGPGGFVIWGSGSKCVSLMHMLGLGPSDVGRIVDINPHRHGKFAPGLQIPISAPRDLISSAPVPVLVMNPIYCEEIAALCAQLGVPADLIPLK